MTDKPDSPEAFRVVVFADFVCPYSFLAVDQIDRLAREYNVQPLWRPHWLAVPIRPPKGFPPHARQTRRTGFVRGSRIWRRSRYDRVRIPEKRQYELPCVRSTRIRIRPRP